MVRMCQAAFGCAAATCSCSAAPRSAAPRAPAKQGAFQQPPKASPSPRSVPRCTRCTSRHAQHAGVEVEGGLGVLDAHHRLQRGTGMCMHTWARGHAASSAALPSAALPCHLHLFAAAAVQPCSHLEHSTSLGRLVGKKGSSSWCCSRACSSLARTAPPPCLLEEVALGLRWGRRHTLQHRASEPASASQQGLGWCRRGGGGGGGGGSQAGCAARSFHRSPWRRSR